jgi:hypothetical protein
MPAGVDATLILPGLSPVAGKALDVRFDGGDVSSDGGLLVLREVDRRLGVAEALAACLRDDRNPAQVCHTDTDMIRFRTLAIVAGYADGDDCDALRHDPVFKITLNRAPLSGDPLCSQPTMSRLENRPTRTMLYRMGRAMIDVYCACYRTVPRRIVLDIDDTFDPAHGAQQLTLFNGYHGERGFQPFHIYDETGRPVMTVLRPGKRPSGAETVTLLKRVIGRIRENWPRVTILLRGDGHYATPETITWCRAEGIDYVFGLPGNVALDRRVARLCETTAARFAAFQQKNPKVAERACLRRVTDFWDAARSWPRTERIVARVEARAEGVKVRSVVTSLTAPRAKALYENTYAQRGQMENFIKEHKRHLQSDRTSCPKATANQFRLFVHTAAYWLLWMFRTLAPPRSDWRRAQFDTLRLHLIKLGARVIEQVRRGRVHLPTGCPAQDVLQAIAGRLPRFVP